VRPDPWDLNSAFYLVSISHVKEKDLVDLQSIIENYGYAVILLGTFLEGETILVLGGVAAHQGYLALP